MSGAAESPDAVRVPMALDDLLELARAAAIVVHGAAPLDDKLAWVCSAARAGAGGNWAAFIRSDAGTGHADAAVGLETDAIEPVASVVISRLLRASVSGSSALYVRDATDLGVRSDTIGGMLAVPVQARSHALQGALLVGLAADNFTSQAERIVQVLATHLAVALENRATLNRLAELEAAQREVVHQLQEAVRPPIPAVESTELGVHYLAADPHEPTGGDLYDWQLLPDGDLHVAVVDVLGKGVAATKDALAVTYTLRLLVLGGCPMADLVQRADELLQGQSPDLVATLLIARYRPSTGDVWLAGGGHPPALVVRHPDASDASEVSEVPAPGIPIGWPGAGSSAVVHFTLGRSDTLLLYTDGLIESTKNVVDGLDHLRAAAVETATYPAPQLARTLVERTLAGAERRDDTLALALRRRTPPLGRGDHLLGPFQYRFTANLAAVPLARHFLSEWLGRQPIDPEAVGDLLLAASELCANAVRAAAPSLGTVVLRARTDGNAVVVQVEDDAGDASAVPAPGVTTSIPDPDAEQGRGLYLVRALTDSLEIDADGGRTVARCVKRAVVAVPPSSTSATAPAL